MKIGVSGDFFRAQFVKQLGYDFMEENLFKMAALDDAAFSEFVRGYEKLDLPVLSFNSFFAGDFPLYTPDALDGVKRYSEKALSRAASMGATMCVLGSGGARSIPDGVDKAWAVRRFVDVLSVCGEIAGKYGIRIAIEPLYYKDSNFVHTVADAALLARRCGNENVGALVDFYHFSMNTETDAGLLCAEDLLIHAHIARGVADRLPPMEEDIPTVKKWAKMLRDVHYEGNLVLEGKISKTDPEEALRETKPILEIIRQEYRDER